MLHSRARRHPLELASVNDGAIAHAVSMFEGSFQDIGDDFHVSVAVHPETSARLHVVFIDDSQGPEAHVGRIVVGVEGEGVPRIEPVVLGVPSLGGPPHMDGIWSHVQFVYDILSVP